ncbi:hypothetical protein AB0N17_46100 [Streptomyces sp. NPDC051133]|uniref:hypothetical protein n=1 Tax=Streptomyces sp. NPDC051133 TaxID=3155521 RepID=UPI00343A0AF4
MMPSWLSHALAPGARQCVIVALFVPAALIALTATVPAMLVLPFLPDGTGRAVQLLTAHTDYIRTLLDGSQP